MVGAKLATLHELDTVYGAEDVYDLLEILYVDNLNEQRMHDYNEKKRGD